jgi:hypothetical protein
VNFTLKAGRCLAAVKTLQWVFPIVSSQTELSSHRSRRKTQDKFVVGGLWWSPTVNFHIRELL